MIWIGTAALARGPMRGRNTDRSSRDAIACPRPLRAEGGRPDPGAGRHDLGASSPATTPAHTPKYGRPGPARDRPRPCAHARTDCLLASALAPVDGNGRLARLGRLLASTDSATDSTHLLVHISTPMDHIQRAQRVNVGDRSRHRVVPSAFDCGNYGTARTFTTPSTQLDRQRLFSDRSVPFIGNYAIEGPRVALDRMSSTCTPGIEFTSTNARNGWTAPAISPSADDSPEDTPAENRPDTSTPDEDQEPVNVPAVRAGSPPGPSPTDAPVGGWQSRRRAAHKRRSPGSSHNFGSPLLRVHRPQSHSRRLLPSIRSERLQTPLRRRNPNAANPDMHCGRWSNPGARVAASPACSAPRQSVTIPLAAGGPNMVSWQGPDRDIAAGAAQRGPPRAAPTATTRRTD